MHSWTFYIELSMKFVGVGLNMAPRKIDSLVTLDFFLFLLKCQMIVHEMKTKKK